MACYIEKEAQYGVNQYDFDSGALISRDYEPDSHILIFTFDTKQTNFKEHGLREGDIVRVHYEKDNNGFDLTGRVDDINDAFMTVFVGDYAR